MPESDHRHKLTAGHIVGIVLLVVLVGSLVFFLVSSTGVSGSVSRDTRNALSSGEESLKKVFASGSGDANSMFGSS